MKKLITIISLISALMIVAATLSGCATAEAASEKIVLSPKAAATPEETQTIVLGLGGSKPAATETATASETSAMDPDLEMACEAAVNTAANTAVLKKATTASSSDSAEDTTSEYPQLREGLENDDVAKLQRRLVKLGYLDNVTRYYGTDTEQAVANFQADNGLDADGMVGSRTWTALFGETEAAE